MANANENKEVKKVKARERLFGEMPHNLEAEQSILGCMILDNSIQTEMDVSLKESDFYSESNKLVFNAMTTLIKGNKPVDLVTLSEELEKEGNLQAVGGIEYLTKLTDVLPSSANYREYLEIVSKNSLLRRLMSGSIDIIEDCQKSTDKNSSVSFAEKTIFDITKETESSEIEKIGNILPELMAHLDEINHDKSKASGIKTGYYGLDAILNGFHNSDLMILAARPGVGKTSFAMNLVANIARQGKACAVFSLEMSKEQLALRLLCSEAEVSMKRVSRGEELQSDWVALARARMALQNSKIYIDDSALITPREIMSKCRKLKRKGELDFVMVDYMQLMKSDEKIGKDENRQQEVSEISRTMKILAKEIDVPVLVLSQLNRNIEKDNRVPQLSDLRESGSIEQDADIVMFIHRPDKGKDAEAEKAKANVAQILIRKHRNGEQGTVELYFEGSCTRFYNIDLNGVPDMKNKPADINAGESTENDDASNENGESENSSEDNTRIQEEPEKIADILNSEDIDGKIM